MGDLTLTAVDAAVMERLATLADANHVSMEEQAKELLRKAVTFDRVADRVAHAKRISAMTPRGAIQTDSVILLREDRDR